MCLLKNSNYICDLYHIFIDEHCSLDHVCWLSLMCLSQTKLIIIISSTKQLQLTISSPQDAEMFSSRRHEFAPSGLSVSYASSFPGLCHWWIDICPQGHSQEGNTCLGRCLRVVWCLAIFDDPEILCLVNIFVSAELECCHSFDTWTYSLVIQAQINSFSTFQENKTRVLKSTFGSTNYCHCNMIWCHELWLLRNKVYSKTMAKMNLQYLLGSCPGYNEQPIMTQRD